MEGGLMGGCQSQCVCVSVCVPPGESELRMKRDLHMGAAQPGLLEPEWSESICMEERPLVRWEPK